VLVGNYRVLEASLRIWDKSQAAIHLNAYYCNPADRHSTSNWTM
jgi:hypothetical protein